MTETVVAVLSTCPDEPTGKRIAEALVSEGHATCVNRLSGVQSTYFWDGRLQDDAEILLIIKTTGSRIARLTERIQALHPYELPEVIAIPVSGGNEGYLDWVRAGVRKNTE